MNNNYQTLFKMIKLEINNFKCWKRLSLEIPENSITLIKGNSGIGKTTIFQAISWCLYGKIKNINPIDKKSISKTYVILFLKKYIIKRTKNPNILTIEYNNKLFEDKTAQYFINNLFGEYEIWLTSCYINQNSKNLFVTLNNNDKLTLLEKISFNDENPNTIIENIDNKLKDLNKSYEKKKNKLDSLNNQEILDTSLLLSDEDIKNYEKKYNDLIQVKNLKTKLIYQECDKEQYNNLENDDLDEIIYLLKIRENIKFDEKYCIDINFSNKDLENIIIKENLYYKNYNICKDNNYNYNEIEIKNRIIYLKNLIEDQERLKILNKINNIKIIENNTNIEELNYEINIQDKLILLKENLSIKELENQINDQKRLIIEANIRNELNDEEINYEEILINIQNELDDQERLIIKEEIKNQTDDKKIKNEIDDQERLILLNKINEIGEIPDNLEESIEYIQNYIIKLELEKKYLKSPLNCPNCNIPLIYHENKLNIINNTNNNINNLENKIKENKEILENLNLLLKNKNKKEIYLEKLNNYKILSDNTIIFSKEELNKKKELYEKIKYYNTLPILSDNTIIFSKEELNKKKELLKRIRFENYYLDNNEISKKYKILDEETLLIKKKELQNALIIKKENEEKEFLLKDLKLKLKSFKILSDNEIIYNNINPLINELNKLSSIEFYELPEYSSKICKNSIEKNKYLEINNKIPYYYLNSDIKVLENNKIHKEIKKYEVIEDFNLYDIIERNNKIKDYIKLQEIINNKKLKLNNIIKEISSLKYIKEKAIEIRSLMLNQTINVINSSINNICENLFDNSMIISLQSFKETKKNIKPFVNFNINYKQGIFDNIDQLSGGEGDRISIALTMAFNKLSNCPFVLLDESLGSLDINFKELVIKTIKEHTNNTIIIIMHEGNEGIFDNIIDLNYY